MATDKTRIESEAAAAAAEPWFDPAQAEHGTVAGHLAANPGPPAPGAALAIPTRAEIEALLAPYELDLLTWGRSLFGGQEFPEADPDEAGIGILAAIMTAESSEAALTALDLKRAKHLCGDTPGGHSPLLEITGARVLRSEFEEGAPCYVIVKAVIVAEGDKIQFTTGSKAIQTVIFKHILEGWMPFRAILTMRSHPTKRGYYPLGLEAGG